jgi:hypothetical protein
MAPRHRPGRRILALGPAWLLAAGDWAYLAEATSMPGAGNIRALRRRARRRSVALPRRSRAGARRYSPFAKHRPWSRARRPRARRYHARLEQGNSAKRQAVFVTVAPLGVIPRVPLGEIARRVIPRTLRDGLGISAPTRANSPCATFPAGAKLWARLFPPAAQHRARRTARGMQHSGCPALGSELNPAPLLGRFGARQLARAGSVAPARAAGSSSVASAWHLSCAGVAGGGLSRVKAAQGRNPARRLPRTPGARNTSSAAGDAGRNILSAAWQGFALGGFGWGSLSRADVHLARLGATSQS